MMCISTVWNVALKGCRSINFNFFDVFEPNNGVLKGFSKQVYTEYTTFLKKHIFPPFMGFWKRRNLLRLFSFGIDFLMFTTYSIKTKKCHEIQLLRHMDFFKYFSKKCVVHQIKQLALFDSLVNKRFFYRFVWIGKQNK